MSKCRVTRGSDPSPQEEAHLPGGLHSLPDTEVADEPDGSQAESQLPADGTQLIQRVRQTEHLPPENVQAAVSSERRPQDPLNNSTHSQNSMTGDVAFSSGLLPLAVWLRCWKSTQESAENKSALA